MDHNSVVLFAFEAGGELKPDTGSRCDKLKANDRLVMMRTRPVGRGGP